MMNQEIILLKDFEKNALWFSNHLDKLREKFKNNFVAVENEDVTEKGKNIEEITNNLKKKGKNPSGIFIDFVPEKDFIMIF